MCKDLYGAGRPANFSSDPHCGFKHDGSFDTKNWQCASLNRLRCYAEEKHILGRYVCRNGDISIGVVAVPIRDTEEGSEGGGYIVMGWYKNRGCTSSVMFAWETFREATLEDVETALGLLRSIGQQRG
jgi:hypothetical protein